MTRSEALHAMEHYIPVKIDNRGFKKITGRIIRVSDEVDESEGVFHNVLQTIAVVMAMDGSNNMETARVLYLRHD